MATGYPAAFLFTFASARFDPAGEPENPAGGVAGHAVLDWLAAGLEALGYRTSRPPHPEAWGWYLRVDAGGEHYDVSAARQPARDRHRWLVQVRKQHTLWEKLRGRSRMQVDEALPRDVERLLREGDGIEDLAVDHEEV